jgi:hypothetical protein
MSKKTSWRRKGRPIQLPIPGDAKHNAGFMLAIGGLVIAWANNESVFLAMLQLLLKADTQTAHIVWHSHRTTQARLEMAARLARETIKDAKLLIDIERAISQFRGFSRVRNFFCHATYSYADDLRLQSATGVTLTQEGNPIRLEQKRMDGATLNEITSATMNLMDFNAEIWGVVSRLAEALGAPPVKRPSLPGEHQ